MEAVAPGDEMEGFKVFFAGAGDDFGGERGCWGLLVPVNGFEIVTNVLLVEGGLWSSGVVGFRGPVA